MAAHARSAESVKMCVRNGVDVIYHATLADAEALDMLEAAKDRIFVAPAVGIMYSTAKGEGSGYGLTSDHPVGDLLRARARALHREHGGAEEARRCASCRAATTASRGTRSAPTRATWSTS